MAIWLDACLSYIVFSSLSPVEPSQNFREILQNVAKLHGVSNMRKLGHLNNFIKVTLWNDGIRCSMKTQSKLLTQAYSFSEGRLTVQLSVHTDWPFNLLHPSPLTVAANRPSMSVIVMLAVDETEVVGCKIPLT